MVKSKETAKHVFLSVHDFLDVGTAPRKVDCIFVFAGRPERKEYALQLYWKGWATRIIISVDRFEWRRFLHLDGVDCAELLRLVHTTTPTKRHFFIQLDTTGAKAFLIPKRKFGTLSEAMALSEFAERLRIKSLMIVSSSFHLRRAMNVVGNCCANVDLELIPVAVPFELSSETRENWWKTSKGFTLILSEYLKNFVYTFFAIPAHSFCRKKVEPRVGTI